jgi:acetyl esterase/lipase
MARVPLALSLIAVLLAEPAGALERPGVLRSLAYLETGDAEAPTLDLYLPAEARRKPPLVAFVHSRFWSRVERTRRLDAWLARPLQREGAAVAVIRHRLAPDHLHPTPARDVAAAVAWLVRHAKRYGYDPKRIFLAGHASGAHLAALLALDPGYLEEVGLEPAALAGVIAMSGIYDLDPGDAASEEERALYAQAFGDVETRRAASPLRLVRPDAPRFLVLAAGTDIPGYLNAGDAFAEALRGSGHPDAEFYFVLGRDHFSVLDLQDTSAGAALYLLAFLGFRPLPPQLAELDEARRRWRQPPFSTEPFWELGVPVQSFPVDERFLATARSLFAGLAHRRMVWEPERFHAVELEALLDALGPERVGSGPWLTLGNVHGERTTLSLEEIRLHRPVLVIGIDDDRNLFTIPDIFRLEHAYSWRDAPEDPPFLARPMGAFLYLLEPPEEPRLPTSRARFSVAAGGLARSTDDPLAALRELDPAALRILTVEGGCIQCHSLRGLGGRGRRLRARDAEPHGAEALPLEEYPPEVWRRFCFEPRTTADLFGSWPHPGPGPAAGALHDAVERERTQAR